MKITMKNNIINPDSGCKICNRLYMLRKNLKQSFPNWHNAPVPSFGKINAKMLIVGLAPGMKGANATGRPFTGDAAGEVLYNSLKSIKLTEGKYSCNGKDNFQIKNIRITNAVRCVPPKNLPTKKEIESCNLFLTNEILSMPKLKVILALGRVAHFAIIKAIFGKGVFIKFSHNSRHNLEKYILYDSYHCSRYNINTKRLTLSMFKTVLVSAASEANLINNE